MKVILSKHRDIPILKFLYRWKLAPTTALHRKFFHEVSPKIAYRRLWKLEQAGFLRTYTTAEGELALWGLDKDGFKIVRDGLPPLVQECFRSEHILHDYWTTAFHIGDLLLISKGPIKVFSEQELRSYCVTDYPSWVPTSKRHRPDGYWNISHQGNQKTIAVEVELTRKSSEKYLTVRDFYDEHPNIDSVIWLAETPTMAKYISQRVNKTIPKHSFITLDQFKANGWDARLIEGANAGLSVRQAVIEKPMQSRWNVHSTHFLLDTRKTPYQTRPCREVTPIQIGD